MKKKSKQKKTRLKKRVKLPSFFALSSFFLVVVVLFSDILSKYLVHSNIPRMSHISQWYPYKGIGVFEDFAGIEFSIVHAINRGAAWGILADFSNYLLAFRIVLVAALIAYLFFYNKNRMFVIPVTFITAGAIGNILDYFIYGHVVDMFNFVLWGYDYPVFNLADSSIFVGICTMVAMTLFQQRKTLLTKA